MKRSMSSVFLAGVCATGLAATASLPKYGKRRITLSEAGPMIPPVPAVLLTVNGRNNGPDEISVVWSFIVEGRPPHIGVSIHKEHIASGLVRDHGQFVLNVPTADIITPFDIVDMNSSKIMDKFKLSGLTRGRAVKVDAPTVEESPIQVECEVFDAIEVPPARTLFLAEVVATTVREGVCDEAGRLVVPAVEFFGMTAGSGEFYTKENVSVTSAKPSVETILNIDLEKAARLWTPLLSLVMSLNVFQATIRAAPSSNLSV